MHMKLNLSHRNYQKTGYIDSIVVNDNAELTFTYNQIKTFKIKKEEASSAGVRRIKAVLIK